MQAQLLNLSVAIRLTRAVSKRPQSESTALLKRQRTEDQDPSLQELIVAAPDATSTKGALIQTVKRTSGLTAPIMCLRVSSAATLPKREGQGPMRRAPRPCQYSKADVAVSRTLARRATKPRCSTSSSLPTATRSRPHPPTRLSSFGGSTATAKSAY